jgi:biopolymer transport protein ExbD
MPPKTLAKAGLIALALALVLPWSFVYWLRTRTFEPVDKPVLLEPGKIQTEDFALNLSEDYSVRIDLDYSEDDWNGGKCAFRSWQDTDWKVYRVSGGKIEIGELWASSAEILKQGEIPDGFHGEPGKYRLEWSVPGASACMNARHPRVHVYTSSSGYEQVGGLILILCVFLAGTGILLMLRGLGDWAFGYFFDRRPPRIFPEMVLRNVIPWKLHQPMPPICDISNFRVVCVGVLFVCLVFFLLLTPLTPKGLLVDFREQRAMGVEKSPWTETISVYVGARKGFLVNGHRVKPEELEAKLKEELSQQMVWTVYLEADSDCLFMDLVRVIETIQGLGAKVIWITPKTREEWKQKTNR